MKRGVVKFYNNEKGFGFIVDSDSKEDVFVHKTGLVDNIQEDDEVEFEMEQGKRGLNAVNVSKV
ncbi:MAG: cold shock domain-containing protein [Crocinitomicaceae bacterium]|jgi:CspA family cold shock protein|tara:strand:- start:3996 stop:4187 length:192 start_codon:yes stop_codon:yes gene_type:complete